MTKSASIAGPPEAAPPDRIRRAASGIFGAARAPLRAEDLPIRPEVVIIGHIGAPQVLGGPTRNARYSSLLAPWQSWPSSMVGELASSEVEIALFDVDAPVFCGTPYEYAIRTIEDFLDPTLEGPIYALDPSKSPVTAPLPAVENLRIAGEQSWALMPPYPEDGRRSVNLPRMSCMRMS